MQRSVTRPTHLASVSPALKDTNSSYVRPTVIVWWPSQLLTTTSNLPSSLAQSGGGGQAGREVECGGGRGEEVGRGAGRGVIGLPSVPNQVHDTHLSLSGMATLRTLSKLSV